MRSDVVVSDRAERYTLCYQSLLAYYNNGFLVTL